MKTSLIHQRNQQSTIKVSSLFGGDIHRSSRVLPVDIHGATVSGFLVRDREVLHRGRKFRCFHIHTSQLVALVFVGGSPLAGFLVDDQSPLVGVGNGKQRVASS